MNFIARSLTEGVAAALASYFLATALEAGAIRALPPTEGQLTWASDVVLAVAVGVALASGTTIVRSWW